MQTVHVTLPSPRRTLIHDDAARHPFLARVEVQPDGRRRVTLRVYCPRTGGTAPVEKCEHCELAEAVEHTGPVEGWVICALRAEAATPEKPAPLRTVAEIARQGVISVQSGVPENIVWELLDQGGPRLLTVVDEIGAYRGWIRPSYRLAQLGQLTATAGSLFSHAITIEETAPADMALRQMATSRLREILVVSVDREPVALLTDLDALRVVAADRHGKR